MSWSINPPLTKVNYIERSLYRRGGLSIYQTKTTVDDIEWSNSRRVDYLSFKITVDDSE